MPTLTVPAAERLLLLLANYGRTLSAAMEMVAPEPELVNESPIIVLCALDLHGARRPGDLQELTGLSSGGVSKLLDRMEAAKVIKRSYGAIPGDNRGVHVAITPQGWRLVRRISAELAKQLPGARSLMKEISTALEA